LRGEGPRPRPGLAAAAAALVVCAPCVRCWISACSHLQTTAAASRWCCTYATWLLLPLFLSRDHPPSVQEGVLLATPRCGHTSHARCSAPQVLASIGQLEFFYDQAPDVMRSCSMALQLLSTALGSYLSGALLLGVQRWTDWLPRDLNAGRCAAGVGRGVGRGGRGPPAAA
jgi:hypothetical protein